MNPVRRILAAVGLVTASALALSACGSDTATSPSSSAPVATSSTASSSASATGSAAGSSADGSSVAAPSSVTEGTFPVTVKNIYGETTIEQAPTRVATVSWVNPDIALALGVVPVGMDADAYGANADKSTDWKDEALAGLGASIGTDKAPAQWDAANGINFDAIADATPDVILAAYSGLTQDEYDKLSKIAPVVGPVAAGYTTSWQDATTVIGAALGKGPEAAALISTVEGKISAAGAANPVLKGKTFIAASLDPTKTNVSIYAAGDTRPRFLTALGLTQAPVVAANTKAGAFYFEYSGEKANELKSDIIFSWGAATTTLKVLQDNKLLGQIPAIKSGAALLTSDEQLTLSISASSPLSLQWALPKFVPLVVKAAETADGS
ncbi:ABC transporter substrate-binding protein [Nakamurella sp. A5-74]|uniref:ABC transporter substrate-binding protein n=1 Tax=Nakamurella sp. A5-74 TaxID=3158264 RepID=A0AAU8DNI3_9ACTN